MNPDAKGLLGLVHEDHSAFLHLSLKFVPSRKMMQGKVIDFNETNTLYYVQSFRT